MECPYCSNLKLKVTNKRSSPEGIRRRRECLKCKKRFTTYERVEFVDLAIVKKDNSREKYSRDKLKAGLTKACEKRAVSMEEIEQVVDEIESKIRAMDTTEIPSKTIGELIMKKLKSLDKVAYIRFASVYRDFADVEAFKSEVEKLLKR